MPAFPDVSSSPEDVQEPLATSHAAYTQLSRMASGDSRLTAVLPARPATTGLSLPACPESQHIAAGILILTVTIHPGCGRLMPAASHGLLNKLFRLIPFQS